MIQLLKLLPKKYKEYKRIYRGSEHNFEAKKFHEECDGKGETFIIV